MESFRGIAPSTRGGEPHDGGRARWAWGKLRLYGDYRLASETITADPAGKNGTLGYTYGDGVGNRTQMTSTVSGIVGGSYSYDVNDRLTTDGYDANGNTLGSGGVTYNYDFEDRLAGGGTAGMVYDGDGNRVSESVGLTTTKFLVDMQNPSADGLPQVMDETVNGSVTRTYAYGLDRVSEN